MSKSAPKAPDYRAAAEQQGQSSREVTEAQTYANRPDQYTPFGSQTWQATPTYDPNTGKSYNRWAQTTELTPESQAALDAQLGLTRDRSQLASSLFPRAQSEFGSAMDWGQFSAGGDRLSPSQLSPEALQRSLSSQGLTDLDPSQRYFQKAEDAIYGKFASRMDPRFQRDEERLRARLYAQGLREGDEAFNQEMLDQRQSQNDAYEQAAYQATIGGGAEAQRFLGMDAATRAQMFGERGQQGAFANQAAGQAFGMDATAGGQNFQQQQQASAHNTMLRQQEIAEELQRRGFSLNEINAIITGQQVGMPSMPGFNTAQRADATNYFGAAQAQGQYNLDQFNAQQAGAQGLMSGAGSLAQGAMMFSDRRLKRNIKFLGTLRGLKIYAYEYIWGTPGVGVMSDEIPQEFVVKHPSGYDMVNYASLIHA